jgi:hypothetical protein
MSNTAKSLFNFSKLEDTSIGVDCQRELKMVWLDHLKADNSGVYERSINHGLDQDCKCCTRSPSDLILERRVIED